MEYRPARLTACKPKRRIRAIRHSSGSTRTACQVEWHRTQRCIISNISQWRLQLVDPWMSTAMALSSQERSRDISSGEHTGPRLRAKWSAIIAICLSRAPWSSGDLSNPSELHTAERPGSQPSPQDTSVLTTRTAINTQPPNFSLTKNDYPQGVEILGQHDFTFTPRNGHSSAPDVQRLPALSVCNFVILERNGMECKVFPRAHASFDDCAV
jgi:hypothetical protein